MENDTEAQAAITALYDSEVMGRKIIVNESQPKQQGGSGGGFKKRSFGGGSGGGGGYKKVASTMEMAVVAASTETINFYTILIFIKILLPFGGGIFF